MLELGFKFVNCFGHSVQSEVRRFQSMIEAQGRQPDQPVLMLPANWPANFGYASHDDGAGVGDHDMAA